MDMKIIKGNQSEMNTISEIKSTLAGINRVDEAENQITDLENGVAEETISEQQQEKKNPKK